ncbi:hypothetical protein [Candidatus Sarmatiella mevalonica]|uniref:hypothetical protein n=1 Tax=Candidatus Sarmatiella mevalonica TaxID=2770581 RepID=UPI00192049E1|nr:hypothetical protein [Candidatus Sarmatiella mevalonica]
MSNEDEALSLIKRYKNAKYHNSPLAILGQIESKCEERRQLGTLGLHEVYENSNAETKRRLSSVLEFCMESNGSSRKLYSFMAPPRCLRFEALTLLHVQRKFCASYAPYICSA